MRGLLFAILFCAFSLLVARGISASLATFGVIQPYEIDTTFGMLMLTLLIGYLLLGPRFKRDDE